MSPKKHEGKKAPQAQAYHSFGDLPGNQQKDNKSDQSSSKIKKVVLQGQGRQLGNNHIAHIPVEKQAWAPYNFVPLNEQRVEADTRPGRDPSFDRYHNDNYTGWIDLQIQAITPLYIRDAMNAEELSKTKRYEADNHRFINSDFFSAQGAPTIPGSSLRGMIRHMVEIVSFGKFGFFDDKRLYFRGLADKSSLRQQYQKKMSSYDKKTNKSIHRMLSGLLFKKGLSYFICPAGKPEQIPKERAKKLVATLRNRRYETFQFYELPDGYLVVSGDMPKKGKDWWIEMPRPNAVPIAVPDDVVLDYRNDKNRNSVDLLELVKKYPAGVPCFYVNGADGKITCFGHTGMFRIAYDRAIGDHIPEKLRDPDFLDIAGAIFGNEKTFAGRIFVEDAKLAPGQKGVLQHEAVPKILSSPKPTTFQHYLVQTSDNVKELLHHNDDTCIRGNKWYWHNTMAGFNAQTWQDLEVSIDSVGISDTQHTKIKPVKPSTKFVGRIRFENLSAVELGALLFVLKLPCGCAHKLGMGKPLGLGSVEITPTLCLTNRKERYTQLLAQWSKDSIKPETPQTITELCKKFENYVLSQIEEKASGLWDCLRLKQFKALLSVNHGKPVSKIRYMLIEGANDNEFTNRPVLPLPEDVK